MQRPARPRRVLREGDHGEVRLELLSLHGVWVRLKLVKSIKASHLGGGLIDALLPPLFFHPPPPSHIQVSVGPSRIEVTPDKNMARSTAVGVIQVTPGTDGSFPERSPQNEWSDLSSVVVSESRSSKIPIVDTAAAKADIKEAIAKSLAAVTGGVEGLAARDGEKRQFADFSEHVQVKSS